MPQDGSNNYYYPPGTPGIPDQTIESEAYNTFLNDLVNNDLNIARPVHRGGTGASAADQGLVNLAGEKATQLVTNFDSHVWLPGSFRSTNAAGQAAPVDGHAFAGLCYLNEPFVYPPTNQNLIVEARDESDTVVPGRVYVRQKKAGVWDAGWVEQVGGSVDLLALADARYVDVAGDTMTGPLVLPGDAALALEAVPKQQLDAVAVELDAVAAAAAPLDALAYNGMQINGSMEISQELGDVQVSLDSQYICDGYKVFKQGTSGFAVGRSVTVPVTTGIYGCIHLTIATAEPSLGAGSYITIDQLIEGYRVARLAWGTAAAKPITIGFWSQHHRTGVYSVTVYNSAYTRSYSATYTHSGADVSQYNVVTIPGDTTGVWLKDNQLGLAVSFAVACGSIGTAPSANTWHPAGYAGAPGQVNAAGSTSDVFRITGLIVLSGIVAPTAAQSPLLVRPLDQELAACMRYYEKTLSNIRFPATGAGQYGVCNLVWNVQKRATPTVAYAGGGTFVNVTSGAFSNITNIGGRRDSASVGAGDVIAVDEIITVDARL